MVKLFEISKSYGSRSLFKSFSIELPDKGVVAIVGHSGSGKTTLLNMLGGLDFSFEGDVQIDDVCLKKIRGLELSNFRLKNIGYVFQNFNLFNTETVFENIYLPLNSVSNAPKRIKKRKVDEILEKLDIKNLRNKQINKLSGGEKQRVAIGRAVINNPKIVLCDEPTGALDENNAKVIYKLLRLISKNTLVVIASHDISGVSNIADILLEINDGKISAEYLNNPNSSTEDLVLISGKQNAKPCLPISFKISHALQKNKAKKWRSIITNLMLSLSLTGVGLSIIITDSVSKKVNQAFSEILNGNEIVITNKNASVNTFTSSFSATFNQINSIATKYPDQIEGIGANYMVNFEDFFKDCNNFYFYTGNKSFLINSLSARNINDFKWFEKNLSTICYPYEPEDINDDQVVIGLSYEDMVNLCFTLQIKRDYTSLGHYIYENGLSLVLDVKNNYWQYEDQQIFDVVAITESNESKIFHTNQLWNEFVFEDCMRLPSDDNNEHFYPWEMQKIYYLKTYEDSSIFLDKLFYDNEYSDFVFERTNYLYNPTICKQSEVCNEKRIFVYNVDKNFVSPSVIQKVQEITPEAQNHYFLSQYGYSSFASSIFSGFSKNVFISADEELLDFAIDADTSIGGEINLTLDLPSGVLQGNYLNTLSDGVRFSTKYEKLIGGRAPKNINEIVISYGLSKSLFNNENPLGKKLKFACEIFEEIKDERILKEYGKTETIIVGVTREEKNYIYHNSDWTISFFRDKLGISNFLLIPNGIVIELDESVNAEKICKQLNDRLKQYSFSSPIALLNENIGSTLKYAKTILISFSILACLISCLLLATIVLLSITESKDEIKLFHYLGFSKRDINSTFLYQSLLQGLLAFLISSVELFFVDQIISYFLNDYLNISFAISLNLKPIFYTFLLAIILPILVSKIMVFFLNKNIKQSMK